MSDAGSESTTWSAAPDAQAAQAQLDIQSYGSGPQRPLGRRSLDAMKVVATPDAGAAVLSGMSAEMEVTVLNG